MIKLALLLSLIFLASTSFAAPILFSITEGKHEENRIFDIYREKSEPDILYSLETNCKAIKNELECFDVNKKKSTYPKQSALKFDKKNYVSEGKLTLEDYYDPTRTPDDKRTPQQRAYDRSMKKAWGSESQGGLVIRAYSFAYLHSAESWAKETGLSVSEINKKGSFINFFCEPKAGSSVCSKGYPGQRVEKIKQIGQWIETTQGWILQSQIAN